MSSDTSFEWKEKQGSLSIIERVMWCVSVILCLATFCFFGFQERLGVVVGCAFMTANVAFWRWIISRFLQKQSNSATRESRSVMLQLVLVGQLKLLLMLGALYFMVRLLPMNPTFLLIGLLVLPFSALLWAGYRIGNGFFGGKQSPLESSKEGL